MTMSRAIFRADDEGGRQCALDPLELRQMASVNPLSGLATRRAFGEAMDLATRDAGSSGRPLWLICIDLDCFKTINDRPAQPVGSPAGRPGHRPDDHRQDRIGGLSRPLPRAIAGPADRCPRAGPHDPAEGS